MVHIKCDNCGEEFPEEEIKWLEETSMDPRSQFYCTEIPPNKRYSDRIWE